MRNSFLSVVCVIKSKSWSRNEGHLFHFPLWIFSSEKDYSLAHCAKSDEFHDYFFQKWIWLCNGLIDVVTVCFLDSWLQTKCRVTFDIRVSDTVFHALSHGTFGFALHGSFFNHVLIGGNSSNSQSDSLE